MLPLSTARGENGDDGDEGVGSVHGKGLGGSSSRHRSCLTDRRDRGLGLPHFEPIGRSADLRVRPGAATEMGHDVPALA